VKVIHALSEDRMTLAVTWRAPAGVQTVTYHRDHKAGPFTDTDVIHALSFVPPPGAERMQAGQRNISRRIPARFGTVWTHIATGPPTWWLPRVKRDKDGAFMAGWLRLAVAVRVDLRGTR
jgi:hypothetical protein